MNNIVALSIEYWTTHYEIKSLHNLNRLIKFYKSILDKGIRDLEYSERHHMIPSCMNMCNIPDEDNMIVMTAREHFIAHLILSKIFKETSKEYHQMNLAIFRMCHSNTSMNRSNELMISSRLYERFRLKYSEAISYSNSIRDCKGKVAGTKNPCYGKKLYHKDNEQKYLLPEQIEEYESDGWIKGGLHFTKEHRERISKAVKGQKRSQEARENMSRAHLGKKLSEEHKKKLSNSLKGRILSDETKDKLSNSMRGNSYGVGNKSTKGRRAINNGEYNLYISPEEINKYLSEGWRLGRIIYSKSKK